MSELPEKDSQSLRSCVDSILHLAHLLSELSCLNINIFLLCVSVPPYFLTKPSDQIVTLGDNLSLMCRADGFPSPRLKWYHRNKLLGNTSRLTIGANGSLVLKRIDRDDAGTYECRAENIAGKNVARASVVVHGRLMRRAATTGF